MHRKSLDMTPAIALDYTAAVHQSAGIGRYVRELTRALVDLHPEVDWRLFVMGAPSALPPPPPPATYRPSPFSERNHNRLWQRLKLPVPVEWWTGRVDLFHELDFSLPHTRAASVVNVHDLAFERYPGETMPGMLPYLKTVVPRSTQRADHVIAISQSTADDLTGLYRLDPGKISVILPGVSARFSPGDPDPALRVRYNLPADPFILTVGTRQPRKNHVRLIQACGLLNENIPLVIAGGKGWYADSIQAEIDRLGLSDRVMFTGFVDDADLPGLYRLAAVFAYPSLYEGFGLPVLEAMACAVPVVTSNGSSLPEAAGDAALLVDPLDVEALAGALERLLADAALRQKLAQKGLEHARSFTWTRAAAQVWAVYETLLPR